MLRWLTAGESHGPELLAILEGLPAGVPVTTQDVQRALSRRRLGYGRGARMKFEQDEVSISGGVRHGLTQGGPVAITVGNTEWPKWQEIMAADPVDPEALTGARAALLTRPRPGHADFTGMQKYGFDEARPVLERASARETAARVALGSVAASFLSELGIRLVTHTVAIGPVEGDRTLPMPAPEDVTALDDDPMRCFDRTLSAAMVAEVDACHEAGDTIGGVVETLVYGLPPGLGSYVHWDRRLDSQLAGALMGIQAIKGVEVGDGFETARRRGSAAHDEIERDTDGIVRRINNRAGGIEGGMSNGEVLRVRAAMKPIATVPRALSTIDVATGEAAKAHHQRSDVCAVPAAGVVAEAMVALVIANSVLEKFGGDSLGETKRNLAGYLASIPRDANLVRLLMLDSQVLVLVGPMGVGKTTVGKKLAKALELPFIDTDALIVEEHGAIADIFERVGEEGFRRIEEEAVAKAISKPAVVATGGGAVLSELTRQRLEHTTVIYLSTDGKHIASRLRGGNRPLVRNGMEDWRRIYKERKPVYSKIADITIETSGQSLSATVAKIRRELDR